jgi:hypothetical protein
MFVCCLYIHVPKEDLNKLGAHALQGTFIEYDGHCKAYWEVIVFDIEKSLSQEMGNVHFNA